MEAIKLNDERLTKEEVSLLKNIKFIMKEGQYVYVNPDCQREVKVFSQMWHITMLNDEDIDMLKFITEHELVYGDLGKGAFLSFAMHCFNYGVMMGKRAERARRRA